MIENRYYKTMEVYTVETLRDVFEYAFVDCPMKQQYMDKLLPLNEGGVSTVKRVEPPKDYALEPRPTARKERVKEARSEEPEAEEEVLPDADVPPNLGRGPTDPLKPFRG